MALLMTRIEVDDYEAWKEMFDGDPFSIRTQATGHRILRTVDDPNELSIAVEFPTAEDAKAARQKLLESGVFERVTLKVGPTVAEEAEAVVY